MTFFPWPGTLKGRVGTGQLTVTSFAVPDKSLPYWRERLRQSGVEFDEATSDFGEEMLFLRDPDRLQLEVVSTPNLRSPLILPVLRPTRLWSTLAHRYNCRPDLRKNVPIERLLPRVELPKIGGRQADEAA
jgi:catechol 2,3-dioxygenase-like lactoylglutathione lyase family enzyme